MKVLSKSQKVDSAQSLPAASYSLPMRTVINCCRSTLDVPLPPNPKLYPNNATTSPGRKLDAAPEDYEEDYEEDQKEDYEEDHEQDHGEDQKERMKKSMQEEHNIGNG